ncbi:transcription termination factor 2-like [Daphnia pulicaria]|uniref:transcription termination factor 2-like n=1 Tax=Daphnia pulicaria TaxID=35523 RepID=UPI001EEA4A94|nr:transcription termination factor 2-like [Daphnia pulicaria]
MREVNLLSRSAPELQYNSILIQTEFQRIVIDGLGDPVFLQKLLKLRAARRWVIAGDLIDSHVKLHSHLRALCASPFDEKEFWDIWINNKDGEAKARVDLLMQVLQLRVSAPPPA